MHICSSTALRNDYNSIAKTAKETQEPVYITKNGEGDTVLMSLEAFERREQMLNLRERLLVAERERIAGQMISLETVEETLRGKLYGRK